MGRSEGDEVPDGRRGAPLEEAPEHQTALRYSYSIVTSGQVSVILEDLASLGYLAQTIDIFLSPSDSDLSVGSHEDGVGEVLLEVVPDHDGESVDVRYGLFDRVERSIAAGGLTNNRLGVTL